MINSAMTVVAIMLVERKGQVFLLKLGTGGIFASLCLLAAIFYNVESRRTDVRAEVAALVSNGALTFDLGNAAFVRGAAEPLQFSILYRYGDQQRVAEAFMPTAASQATLDALPPPSNRDGRTSGSRCPRHRGKRSLTPGGSAPRSSFTSHRSRTMPASRWRSCAPTWVRFRAASAAC